MRKLLLFMSAAFVVFGGIEANAVVTAPVFRFTNEGFHQYSRYKNGTGLEGAGFRVVPGTTPGTRPIFLCYVGYSPAKTYNQFISVDPNCERQPRLAVLGNIYINQVAGTGGLWRLRKKNPSTNTYDYLITLNVFEITYAVNAGWTVEGSLGFTYAP